MQSPIDIFGEIWREARRTGSLEHRNAVCLSTIDADGYPDSRFVDLKDAGEDGFAFCTHLDSVKALDIERNQKAGMTMWWEHVATQIRIKGQCERLSAQEADRHWEDRSRDAQVVTTTFEQSRPLAEPGLLGETYARAVAAHDGQTIARPGNWGGFRLRPDYVEFLEFKKSRLHVRTAYTLIGGTWRKDFLQP